jgi:hypothetical protein
MHMSFPLKPERAQSCPLTLPKGLHAAAQVGLQSVAACAQPTVIQQGPQASTLGPNCSAFRATSFPEVTKLFCRLPLPTFYYALEASNLGDLMRFRYGFGRD